MTNSTNDNTNNTTNLTNEESNMTHLNLNQFHGSLTQSLYSTEILSGLESLVVATAFIENIEYVGEPEFGPKMEDSIYNCTLTIGDGTEGYSESIDWEPAFIEGGLLEDGQPTEKMGSMMDKAAPCYPVESIGERRYELKDTHSDMTRMAINVMENVKFTTDSEMLEIITKVFAGLPAKHVLLNDRYQLEGAKLLDSDKSYVSEYKNDKRFRLYQLAYHGPHSQSSDPARSLYTFTGVDMNYDCKEAMKNLVAEMKDMGKWDDKASFMVDVQDAVARKEHFILEHILAKKSHIKKPSSFTKFSLIMTRLLDYMNGDSDVKPYIGVGFGLDAKCSGPQIAGLMTMDNNVLKACGFSKTKVADMYQRAMTLMHTSGFLGLTREDIKTPFMAIFYGQGWRAFMNVDNCTEEVWNSIHGHDIPDENRAKEFYNIITTSFGAAIKKLRKQIKEFGYSFDEEMPLYDSPVNYFMPDGAKVKMSYKKFYDIFGEECAQVDDATDIIVTCGLSSFMMKKLRFRSKEENVMEHARTGMVNLVQAVDALIARLIITNLHKLGVTSISSVHDCFRVDINSVEKLSVSIEEAYLDLFGTDNNEYNARFPKGLDIIGLYFKGAIKAVARENVGLLPTNKNTGKPITPSQFYGASAIRRQPTNMDMKDLISSLGETYYFSK